MLRWIALAALVLLAPSAAVAGPISWEYSSTLAGNNGGASFVESLSGQSCGGPSMYTAVPVGYLAGGNYSTTQVTGNQTINLGGIVNSSLLAPNTVKSNGFELTFQITDLASGRSGTLDYFGSASAIYTNQTDSAVTLLSNGFGYGLKTLTIGNDRYDVDVWSVTNSATNTATFTASVEALATPEPATWVCVVAGLMVVGVFRRMRLALTTC